MHGATVPDGGLAATQAPVGRAENDFAGIDPFRDCAVKLGINLANGL